MGAVDCFGQPLSEPRQLFARSAPSRATPFRGYQGVRQFPLCDHPISVAFLLLQKEP